ncbi:Arsenite resistance protein [Penicillium pulvis]|uniref:Arsenite resistance protein n=1 Tax=Penicillium pulvis TaxID=1562058 RepID=UPI00254785BC|nr:Arsenite resistance protein [Penicillium pulvis]KAJ5801860.1 Arsenite resistance protein [Penicillium pulvis]
MDSYDTYASPGRKREAESFSGRAPAEYRRRSPASQDRRRGRGRSRSPMIDRYEPSDHTRRDDFYNNSREHAAREREDRRRPPSPNVVNIDRYVPGQDAGKRPPPTNPLTNPYTLDFTVGFNFFAEWWRAEQKINEEKERAKNGGRHPSDRVKGEREARDDREKEHSQIQVAYDAYKVDIQVKLGRQFVQQHRNEEWFKERYVPEVRDRLRSQFMQFRKGAYDQWERDIRAGTFDDFTLEGIYKNESDGAGGVIEKEEGETTAVGETMGVLDLLPVRGGELRDEALSQPTLLIKTLAPNVCRDNIVEFCKEHLGEGDGGFKWLSLSDPNPSKKFHRIGWILLNPAAETVAVDRGDGREEEGEEMDTNTGNTLGTAEKALEAVNDKTIHDPIHGDFVCHVGVHVPPSQPRKKALWDLFSAPERIDRDLDLARRLVSKLDNEMGQGVDGFAKIEERIEDLRGKGWLQPPVTGPVSIKKQSNGYDEDGPDEGEMEEGEEKEASEEDEVDDEDLLAKKKKLDLMVEYLRRVYNFCFFCVFESDSVHELGRKCPGGHLRRPRSGLSNQAKQVARATALGQPFPSKKKEPSEEGEERGSPVAEKRPPRLSKSEQQLQRAYNWVKTFEDKVLQILEPENVDLRKIGGRPVDQALEEELSKYVKQEDDSRYRCKVPECTKLFKAENFWHKHIEKRHTEWLDTIQRELSLVNAYVLDPARIAPSRSDSNSNGHFPMAGGAQSGTPRGFSLANAPYIGNPALPGGFPTAGMPGLAGPTGVWNGNMLMSGDAGMHQPGVMRRGPNRHNSRSGPYDRRRGYNGGPTGRLSPVRMSNMYGPGGRLPPAGISVPPGHPAANMVPTNNPFPDAMGAGGGSQAMPPREAVQGRSLKSYEDLDAVGGSGSGELNY